MRWNFRIVKTSEKAIQFRIILILLLSAIDSNKTKFFYDFMPNDLFVMNSACWTNQQCFAAIAGQTQHFVCVKAKFRLLET